MGATQAMLEEALAAEIEEKCSRCGFRKDHDESVHDFLGDPRMLKWP
jgi:hypothetical protein